MMRVRRASASLALCLLVSAMTACAPCGWLLWEISSPTAKHPDWTYNKVDAEATNGWSVGAAYAIAQPLSVFAFIEGATAIAPGQDDPLDI